MEIERKFLIRSIPDNLEQYEKHELTQAYLCTNPVVRIRQWDEEYILTYKSKGLKCRIEEEMPLNKEAFSHLLKKADGNIISKTRYVIEDKRPEQTYHIELDRFHGIYEGLYLAEVEFRSEEESNEYLPPQWFGEEVTYDGSYHNSRLSCMVTEEIQKLIKKSI